MKQRVNTFECDKTKARINHAKHKIRFTEGARIFDGHVLTAPSSRNTAGQEQRFLSIGILAGGHAAVVVWTRRGQRMRVISVRRARRKERERYHAHIEKTTD